MPILGAIADDLTGGMELAAMLVGRGARVAFITELSVLDGIGEADAVVLGRKIRTAAPDIALAEAEAAAAAFISIGVRQVFYKWSVSEADRDAPAVELLLGHLQR